MVRTIVIAVVLLFVALPAFAQEDFPRVEMSLGYANLAYPCCSNTTFQNSRHSGFASTQGLNMTKNLGIENYFAYYSLGGSNNPYFGSNVSLIANIVGAKIAARTDHAVPYFVAGGGGGYMTNQTPVWSEFFWTRIWTRVGVTRYEAV